MDQVDGRARCPVRAEVYANSAYSAGARGPLPESLYGILYDKAQVYWDGRFSMQLSVTHCYKLRWPLLDHQLASP